MKFIIFAILGVLFTLSIPNAMAETSFEIDGFDVNITSDQTGHLRVFINNSTQQVWSTLYGMETGTLSIPLPILELGDYIVKVTISNDIVELPFSVTQEYIDNTLAQEQAKHDEEERLQDEAKLAEEKRLDDEEKQRLEQIEADQQARIAQRQAQIDQEEKERMAQVEADRLAQQLEDEKNARQEAELEARAQEQPTEEPTPIPSWVKGVAGFWAQGQITDDEFKEAIRFLVNNGILVL